MNEGFPLLDSIPIGAFAISRDFRILAWNPCMEAWTDLPREEAMGRDLRDLFPRFRDGVLQGRLETVLAGGPPVVLSYQLHGDIFPRRQPTLVPRVRQCTASALPGNGGALFAVEDRTDIAAKSREARQELERREAVERDLRKAIAEREMLMRELSHRVKNNLNMVQSLIGLESSTLPEGQARDRLDAIESRVNAIAALHDNLYGFKEGGDIAADDYLASIARHLFSAFGGTAGGPVLELDLDRVAMSPDRIVYLGLAVNELITNAIKYGGKRIGLSLKARPEGHSEVTVTDDGPGFRTPLPLRDDSLGLRLVMMLADQVGGSLEIDGSGGGTFRLRLPARAPSG